MSVTSVQDNQPILATGIPFAAQAGEQAPFANQSATPSFWDFVDAINPLQHIPVVSTIYRAITGDEIGPMPRIVGDMLYGGPLGLLGGVANEVMKKETGEDFGDHALAMLFPGSDSQESSPQVASATPAPFDMVMQAFDTESEPAAEIAAALPPQVTPQPAIPVAMAPLSAPMDILQAPAAQAATPGAITGSLFQPLSQPVDLTAAEAPKPEAPPAPMAAAVPETIIPNNAALLTREMASAGELQPMMIRPTQPPAAPVEAKTFSSKVSPLNHGKMFAAASPYMQKVDPAQKVAQAEGIPADHPMLKAANSGQGDWMASAMAQALDKYSRTQQLVPDNTGAGPQS